MSRLLKITDLGSGIMVQGTDNVLYPDNATLTYPYNSIVVVTDESDIATFRSASNNDVLFSGLIGKIEIGGEIVTKENINVKFDEIANQSSGGGGDVTGLFADASYDSQTKRINFYDKDENIVSYIDATDFIKDGMVSNVEISEGNLVITFNTDSGKEPITIPLTDIFNPNNYYSKTESDAKYATQVVVNEEIASRIAGDGELNAALQAKADKSDTYTKTQVDDALALKQDASTAFSGDYADLTNKPDLSVYAESANLATVATSGSYNDLSDKPTIPESVTVDAALSDTSENPVQNKVVKGALDAKQDTISDLETIRSGAALGATAYQKPNDGIPASDLASGVIPTVPTNVSAFTNDAGYLTQHQSLDDYYTKTEVDTELADKQDTLTAGANITIENNVISSTGGTQVQADWNQTDDTAVDYIKNKPAIPDTNNFATKTELNAKQDTLVSGTNIKTINNQSILGEGNIEIQGGGGEQQQADWNQTDTTAVDYIKNKPTNVSAFSNDAGYLTQHQSLADYYTKSESDNKFALKFTDVDDIQMVSALPSNPDSRTLYLIPVE